MADLSVSSFPDVTSLAREVDLLLVFGGDGTMLSAARSVAGLPTPVLGVNIGSLGFLTEIASARVAEELPSIWKGDFTIEERSLLEVTGMIAQDELFQVALNDFVVSRGATSRLIE